MEFEINHLDLYGNPKTTIVDATYLKVDRQDNLLVMKKKPDGSGKKASFEHFAYAIFKNWNSAAPLLCISSSTAPISSS